MSLPQRVSSRGYEQAQLTPHQPGHTTQGQASTIFHLPQHPPPLSLSSTTVPIVSQIYSSIVLRLAPGFILLSQRHLHPLPCSLLLLLPSPLPLLHILPSPCPCSFSFHLLAPYLLLLLPPLTCPKVLTGALGLGTTSSSCSRVIRVPTLNLEAGRLEQGK